MFKVKEERIRNEHVHCMFYDIPRVRSMIAAQQTDFIGSVVRAPHDRPAQRMLTACCDNTHLVGHPFLHNKDHIVKNLQLLFTDVPEVTIDDFGSLKSWICEASDAPYWNQLVKCLTDQHATLPSHPIEWLRPRQSPRNFAPPHHSNAHFLPPPHAPLELDDALPPLNAQVLKKIKRIPKHPMNPLPNQIQILPLHRAINHPHPNLHQGQTNVITYLRMLEECSMTPSKS
jgi:hypothetical protein